jgi:polyisoprenoid-binding protein YceI
MLRTVLAAAFGLTVVAAPAFAQQAARPAPAVASKDPSAAPAGSYKLDERHVSVIARVPHANGTSYSTFRFGGVKGTLTIDPAHPDAGALSVTVDPKSIASNVAGFGEELGGERYLNVAKYPEATFTSTGIRAQGGKAQITGNLTLMGVTKPAVLNAELVGVGKTMKGTAAIGFTGVLRFKRSDFGFTTMQGPIGDDVELLIDVEFDQG